MLQQHSSNEVWNLGYMYTVALYFAAHTFSPTSPTPLIWGSEKPKQANG